MKTRILILLILAGKAPFCLSQPITYWDNQPMADTFQEWLENHNWSADDWKEIKKTRDGTSIHTRYQQLVSGYPVLGAQLISHQKNGKLYLVSGQAVKKISLKNHSTTDKLQQRELTILSSLVSDQFRESTTAIVIPKLTKRYSLNGSEHYSFVHFYLHPKSKKQLFSIENGKHINNLGTAETRFHGTVQITTDAFNDMYRLREEREGVSIRTLNAQNMTIEEVTDDFTTPPDFDTFADFTDDDNHWDNFNDQMDEIATDIHWATEVTFDYYLQKHERNGIDGSGGEITSVAHLGDNWDEAFFLPPPYNFMGYGDGGGLGPNVTLDVIAHEMTHGIVHYTAGLLYLGESSVLDEGFADIFGTAVKFYQSVPEITDRWKLAEQLGTFRDLSDPKSLGQPDTYLGEFWYTGDNRPQFAHQNNGVINYWFYLITEGGAGINDNNFSYQVEGLGIEKSEAIAYRTLALYITPLSKIADAKNGALQATIDLFGENSFEYHQVKHAWEAVGVVEKIITGTDQQIYHNELEVYPNPVSENLIIRLPLSNKNIPLEVSIHSMAGIKLMRHHLYPDQENYFLDVSSLSDGIYCLSATYGEFFYKKIIVKQ